MEQQVFYWLCQWRRTLITCDTGSRHSDPAPKFWGCQCGYDLSRATHFHDVGLAEGHKPSRLDLCRLYSVHIASA